jgi:hypothetical protein
MKKPQRKDSSTNNGVLAKENDESAQHKKVTATKDDKGVLSRINGEADKDKKT